MPLLHIMIGVFNDIEDYILDVIDCLIIAKSEQELAIGERYEAIDQYIKMFQDNCNAWDKTKDGFLRKKLVARKNKQDAQMVSGAQVEDPLSIDDIGQYQSLQKIRAEKTKERDGKKKEKTDLKEKIDAYRLVRKKDPKSVHNQLERGAKGLGLD